jgi:hypothetical protein
MDDSDIETDPRRRVPMVLWWLLAVALVALFAAVVVMLGGHVFAPPAVGPPAGAP